MPPDGLPPVNLLGDLALEGLRAMLEWQRHKHSIIITRSNLLSTGACCCLFKAAWIWEPVTACFSLAFFFFFHFFLGISVFNKSLLSIALLCHLRTEEEIAVWLRQPPSREEKNSHPSLSSESLSNSFPRVCHTAAATSIWCPEA